MLIKIFTLRFDPRIEGFDDEGLRVFLADKDVKSIREHFFMKDETPYWAFVVNYDVEPSNGEPVVGKRSQTKGPDYRSILQEEHWPLFNTLRDWRSEKAKPKGVPPYLVFTNAQLAQVVVRAPATLAALGEIHGIGAAKVTKYGAEVLAMIGGCANATSPPDEAAAPAVHEGDDD